MTLADEHFAPAAMLPRRPDLERHLVDVAVQAAGVPDDGGLSAYADARAHPGGVRANLHARRESGEELADCCNYLRWGIAQVWDAYEKGDAVAAAEVACLLGALSGLIVVWRRLHGSG